MCCGSSLTLGDNVIGEINPIIIGELFPLLNAVMPPRDRGPGQ
jgi:hypothetical protein